MDKKLESRIRRLEKMLNCKNEDFDDDFDDEWTPAIADLKLFTSALYTALQYANKIATDARVNGDDDVVETWDSIKALVENACDYYDGLTYST